MEPTLLKLTALLLILAGIFSCQKPDDNLKEFTVFFETGENGNTVSSQKVRKGEKVIKPNDPTLSGNFFMGWYKEIDMVNEWKFDVHVVNSDITLYAKWVEWTIEEDPLYPTTICPLPDETLSQMRKDFAQKNPDMTTSLNQFGFCAMLSTGSGNGTPGGFTEEEAIEAVKEFVARNPEYIGVNNPDDLQFGWISSRLGYNNSVLWNFRTKYQTINDIEVYAQIVFATQSWKLHYCVGNHFPNIYIPPKFNFDIEQTKYLLLGKEIIHSGWTCPYSAGIVSEEDLQQCTTKLIVRPLKINENIELRVAWQIELQAPLYYIFEVDVMKGEIIREIPTVSH